MYDFTLHSRCICIHYNFETTWCYLYNRCLYIRWALLISGTHVGPPVEELVLRDRLEGVRRPRDVVRVAAVGDLVAREARRARSACKTTLEIEGAEIQSEEMPELVGREWRRNAESHLSRERHGNSNPKRRRQLPYPSIGVVCHNGLVRSPPLPRSFPFPFHVPPFFALAFAQWFPPGIGRVQGASDTSLLL